MLGLILRDHKSDLSSSLTLLLNTLKVLAQKVYKIPANLSSLLDESKFIARSKSVLEEKRATKAFELTACHDTDSVTQDISFIHVMSGQDDDPISLVHLEHVPKHSSCSEIHARGRLVKYDKL